MQFVYYNANPKQKDVRDCVYRAVSYCFGMTWREAVNALVGNACELGEVNFNYITNITDFLQKKGMTRHKPPRKDMTIGAFADEFAKDGKKYIIHIKKPNHLTVVHNRELVDSWNCSECEINYYFSDHE